MTTMRRVMVLGLDGVSPGLIFNRWADSLPNLSRLAREGLYGPLRSTDPPITVPAWTSMVTGKDPGQIGCYGFRNRRDYSYAPLALADSNQVREPTIWEILSKRRLRSIVLGVPQTYPPKPLRGILVAGFLTPDESCEFTYPAGLKAELDAICGKYLIDVPDFRHVARDQLVGLIKEITRRRFQVIRHFVEYEQWDFFMAVEMGPDRIHHGFWRYIDETHPLFEPNHPYREMVRGYYVFLDSEIGKILELLGPEDSLLVVSDHGARPMMGSVRLNEWLRDKGYLSLKKDFPEQVSWDPSFVDWARTRAWAEGGYYGRIFINVQGREPMGTVAPDDYPRVREELCNELREMQGPDGRPLGNQVMIPEAIYSETKGIPPDIMVYLGGLSFRASSSIGGSLLFDGVNDTGPDDANHDLWGMFILYEPGRRYTRKGQKIEASIFDIAPTILDRLGIDGNHPMKGHPIE